MWCRQQPPSAGYYAAAFDFITNIISLLKLITGLKAGLGIPERGPGNSKVFGEHTWTEGPGTAPWFPPAVAAMDEEVVGMEYLLDHVTQKDVGKRLQVGQEVIELILDEEKSPDLEQDQSMMDRMVDAVASSWVNSSNFKVKF